MFLCKPCHKKIKCRTREDCEQKFKGVFGGFGMSQGACEECGKEKLCVDCHG